MYRINFGDGFFSSPCHTKEFAEMSLKGCYPCGKVERTPFFMQPTFTLQHEWNLIKLIKETERN